jgi:hypothetical protein
MIATIELPNNKAEWTFILEVLKRLNVNVRVIDAAPDAPIEAEVLEEHAAVLKKRRAAMTAPDAQFFTWEEAQNIVNIAAVLHNKRDKSVLKERK